jgi:hypothetical protein
MASRSSERRPTVVGWPTARPSRDEEPPHAPSLSASFLRLLPAQAPELRLRPPRPGAWSNRGDTQKVPGGSELLRPASPAPPRPEAHRVAGHGAQRLAVSRDGWAMAGVALRVAGRGEPAIPLRPSDVLASQATELTGSLSSAVRAAPAKAESGRTRAVGSPPTPKGHSWKGSTRTVRGECETETRIRPQGRHRPSR